jgi:hypothetical protein
MTKDEILQAIRQGAAENGGVPLGLKTFEHQTGLRPDDILGVHWRSWGDAVREAGFQPNSLTGRIEDRELLARYASLTREIGRVPVKADLQLARRRDASFPSTKAFVDRFGTYDALRSRVQAWCSDQHGFDDVSSLIAASNLRAKSVAPPSTGKESLGYVYLIRHGTRSEYKIGRTGNPIRREGEIRLQLPEQVTPVHTIETDDPVGIEAYWHTRFASKRKEGEWFALSPADVKAFKKWKRIA